MFKPIDDGPLNATLCIKSNDENRKEEAMFQLQGNGITYVIDEAFNRNVELGLCTVGSVAQTSMKFTNLGPAPYPIKFIIDESTGFIVDPPSLTIPSNGNATASVRWRAPNIFQETIMTNETLNQLCKMLETGFSTSTIEMQMPKKRIETIAVTCHIIMPQIAVVDNRNEKVKSLDFGEVILNQRSSLIMYIKNEGNFPVDFAVSFTSQHFDVNEKDFLIEANSNRQIEITCFPSDHIDVTDKNFIILNFMKCFPKIKLPVYVLTKEFPLNARHFRPVHFDMCFAETISKKNCFRKRCRENEIFYNLVVDRLGEFFEIHPDELQGKIEMKESKSIWMEFHAPNRDSTFEGIVTIELGKMRHKESFS